MDTELKDILSAYFETSAFVTRQADYYKEHYETKPTMLDAKLSQLADDMELVTDAAIEEIEKLYQP